LLLTKSQLVSPIKNTLVLEIGDVQSPQQAVTGGTVMSYLQSVRFVEKLSDTRPTDGYQPMLVLTIIKRLTFHPFG
jgi:hypothetical protein